MDVLVLIDKLDDLVHNAKAVPLTDQVRIDREEIYDILDQMRATIPEEIKQARWIVKERQEMLAEAKRECDRILGEAREQAAREASQTEIVKLAERQAQEIIDEARRQARETRLEMEDWADGILSTLEVNLDKFLSAVKRGRERLHERSQENVLAARRRQLRRAVLVAALYDVHGNLPALEAVLRELDDVEPDVLLFGGDVAAGPFPHETIELPAQRCDARFVMGNADRTLIDGRLGSMFDWATTQVDRGGQGRSCALRAGGRDRRRPLLPLDADAPTRSGSRSSPRSDLAREILGEVGYPTLVQGHTHTQFDRRIGEHPRRQRRQRRDGQRRRARRLLAARRGRRAGAPPHRLRPRRCRRPPARERVADPRGVARRARARRRSTPLEAAEMVEARARADYQAATRIGPSAPAPSAPVPSVIVQVGPCGPGCRRGTCSGSQP